MVLREGEMIPLRMPVLTVTLQETECELEASCILSDQLTSKALSPILDRTRKLTPSSTGPVESLGQIRTWLKTCDKSHSCCTGKGFLPRLISETSVVRGPIEIRLVESKTLPVNSRYATLSHCRGVSPSAHRVQLTQKLLPVFEAQIPRETLPKTFLDPTDVIRAVGIEYFGLILCIIQDSKDDWKREASTMWEVYCNSYLNISATASRERSEGPLRSRNP
jgi:Heterokaryon incompatibility protein (HET)